MDAANAAELSILYVLRDMDDYLSQGPEEGDTAEEEADDHGKNGGSTDTVSSSSSSSSASSSYS